MPAKWQQWYPHGIDAWQGSALVQSLSDAGYRAYHNLLMEQFQQPDGMLPDDDRQLALLSRMGIRWNQPREGQPTIAEEVLIAFEPNGEGRVFNRRQYEGWLEAKNVFESRHKSKKEVTDQRSESGKRGNAKRWGDRKQEQKPPESSNAPSQNDAVCDGEHRKTSQTGTGTETRTETRGIPPTPLAPLALVPVNAEPLPDFDADEEANIPDGLAPVQYAIFVTEQAAIPAGFALRDKFAGALKMLAKGEKCTLAEATRRMLIRVRAAQDAGETTNGFWLEDGRWKANAPSRAAPKRNAAAVAREEFLAEGA
jgi:hypothetical protein